MDSHYFRVRKFMTLAGQATPDKPIIPSEEIRHLRAKLILEEALETVRGLGFSGSATLYPGDNEPIIYLTQTTMPDLIDIADGCLDVHVVTTGTMIACGLLQDIPQEIVDQNNLAKFGPGGYRRDDGKWVKPPNHKPPTNLLREYFDIQ